jgi:hypothetical protein
MSNYQRPPVIFHRKFTRPRFIVYKVGDPSPFKFVWNRYDTATIGAAIVDRFASGQPNRGKGTKAKPGWFYGFRADIWQAYALAVLVADGVRP